MRSRERPTSRLGLGRSSKQWPRKGAAWRLSSERRWRNLEKDLASLEARFEAALIAGLQKCANGACILFDRYGDDLIRHLRGDASAYTEMSKSC
jgi:hypothetical protein